jgi:hypothetical protein
MNPNFSFHPVEDCPKGYMIAAKGIVDNARTLRAAISAFQAIGLEVSPKIAFKDHSRYYIRYHKEIMVLIGYLEA